MAQDATSNGNGGATLDAHLAELAQDRAYLEEVATMLERIHGQMIQGQLGDEALGALSTARDHITQSTSAITQFTAQVEQVNRPVQQARRDSGGEAGSNAYLTAGR